MTVKELKRQFRSEGQFQLALFSYVYSGDYREELTRLKESLADSKGEDNEKLYA